MHDDKAELVCTSHAAGICPYDQVVCLVVDECHRATGVCAADADEPVFVLQAAARSLLAHVSAAGRADGLLATCATFDSSHIDPAGNSEIVRAVSHMREARCKFRVLGLSATPGADGGKVQASLGSEWQGGRSSAPEGVRQTACYCGGSVRIDGRNCMPCRVPHPNPPALACPAQQEVVTNLMIGAIEFRTEQDPDVARYTHPKDISGGRRAGGLEGCWLLRG